MSFRDDEESAQFLGLDSDEEGAAETSKSSLSWKDEFSDKDKSGRSDARANGTMVAEIVAEIEAPRTCKFNRKSKGNDPDPEKKAKIDSQDEFTSPPAIAPPVKDAMDFPLDSHWNRLKSSLGTTAKKIPKDSTNDEDAKYPPDTYSFLALHGPRERPAFFLFGLLPFVFQVALLVLLLWSVMDEKRGTVGESDNPDSEMGFAAKFIPANTSAIVRATQYIAIAAYVIFPDSSLQDVTTALRTFPRSAYVQTDDPIGCMRFSCLLRGVQGFLATIAALLLVITLSDTVVDIILNFTAVNFISNLDDAAFFLAMSGEFGPVMKAEARQIANEELPASMYRKSSKHVYYRIVTGFVSIFVFGVLIAVMVAQDSNYKWITRELRVQFHEGTGLGDYSGCFEINDESVYFQRHIYNSFDSSGTNTSFGYCRTDRQWILFEDDNDRIDPYDPCDVSRSNFEIARSSRTDSFDISTSFDDTWVSSSGTPLNLYFFQNESNLFCDSVLGDGSCDSSLNQLGYNFDDGDCCSATCTKSICGREALAPVFGKDHYAEISFPKCRDTDMVPLTIHLNDIISSRDEEILPVAPYDPTDPVFSNPSIWRAEPPENPYFTLECNDKIVLTVYIEAEMVNNSETVMVSDGANCTLLVRNQTEYYEQQWIGYATPFWYINYTIFHGEENNRSVRILSQHSMEEDTVNFKRIPECYFRKLGRYIEKKFIYQDIGEPNEAIDWLVAADTENTMCDSEDKFTERYALTKMFFARNGTEEFVKKENQCTWQQITCNQGEVETIRVGNANMGDFFPSEIGLLTGLKQLDLQNNNIFSISTLKITENIETIHLACNKLRSLPSEIGQLSSLSTLKLYGNQLTSIPSEIGQLSNLTILSLGVPNHEVDNREFRYCSKNQIQTIPIEVGTLSSLRTLDLYDNGITFLPSEIGRLSNLRKLDLDYNQVSSLPAEIGDLASLQVLKLTLNGLTSLPTEIGRLIALQEFDITGNEFTSLPSEISRLKNLEKLKMTVNHKLPSIPSELSFGGDSIEFIPTEIGQLSNLQFFEVYQLFRVELLPSEIGQLEKLKTLRLRSTRISFLPTEIYKLPNLQELVVEFSDITSLSSEIGLLTSLEKLDLSNNELTSLPSEIAALTGLETIDFSGNDELTRLPTEVCQMDVKYRELSRLTPIRDHKFCSIDV